MTLFPPPERPDSPDVRRVSLVRLSALIAQAASAIGKVAVEGEVHRVQQGRTGRLWFTLRDRASQVSISVPSARQARCRVAAGERVCVVGKLEWVNEWGQLQLVADEITPVGEGAVAAAIAEARRRLSDDGLLDRQRQRVPGLPSAIGVLCGHEAAVRADIESVVAARFPGYPMVWWETTVSGPGAVDNIVSGIAELNAREEVEVIILARGGGDVTQLLPFSDESVCRAVCASRRAVVAAIGHDGDRPLVDEVADLRCGTPSLAASAIVPDRLELWAELGAASSRSAVVLADRLAVAGRRLATIDRTKSASRRLERAASGLATSRARLDLIHPARELSSARSRLARVDRLGPVQHQIGRATARLEGLRVRSAELSPMRVLERGYAVVRRADGAVVRDPATVPIGDLLQIEVAAGRLAARAETAGGQDG